MLRTVLGRVAVLARRFRVYALLCVVVELVGNMADKLLGSTNAQVKIGNYVLGETLGSGTFGKVKGKRRVRSFD